MRHLMPLLLVSLAMTGCAVNPVTGERELSFVSEAEELQIGDKQYLPSQQSQGGQYNADPALTEYVASVGQRVAAHSDRQLPWEFVVLNNSVPNAWALPGGKIAVNRGLLLELENEAELAAVLGHEVIHSAARHGAKSMERGTLLQGVLTAAAIGAGTVDYGNYIVGGAQVGAKLITTSYGRGAELESDYYGIQYMAQAGYDAEAAISLQEKFVALSGGKQSSWVDGLFASHPPSEERVRKNIETVAALPPAQREQKELGVARYQEKLAYLRSKEKAYQAFDEAGQLAGAEQFKEAAARLNTAITIEPNEPRFYGLLANLNLQQQDYATAVKFYDKALSLDPDYYEYYLGRGLLHSRQGEKAQAKQDFEQSARLLPTAIAMNELGRLSLAEGNSDTAKGYFANAMNAGGETGAAASASYIRIDLPENPTRYLNTRPVVEAGQVKAIVTNKSPLTVAEATVTFSVKINGAPSRKVIKTEALAPGSAVKLASGITIPAGADVTGFLVSVTAASL